ncbi:MAG: type II toxin-antitoxin system RelE/ParE family toxin [Terracidiphilus sp.]
MEGFSVRLRKKALADVSWIRSWYRKIDPVLEDRFVRSLNEGLERIEAHHFGYLVVYRNTRRVILGKFPYSVYYLIQDSNILVLAVIHHKRNPELAQGVAE